MTVSSTPNRVSSAGNGSTTVFSFPYYFLAASDLLVTTIDAGGVIVTKTLVTDYTVSGTQAANGSYPSGGSVTFGVAPAAGLTVSIVRVPSQTQASHWVDGDPDPALVKETAFDKLTILMQRAFDLIARSPALPDGYAAAFSNQLPSVMTPNAGLVVNNAGTGWALAPGTGNAGTVTSVALSVPGEFSASAAVTTAGTLTITKLAQVKNTVWAGPTTGSNAQPAFRALVAADIPSFPLTTLTSGVATLGQVPQADGAGGIAWNSLVGSGTVTSVGISMPAEFSVSSSPVTGAGTLSVTKAIQSANTVWAGPSTGPSSTPSFRNLVPADLPAMVGATSGSNGAAGAVPQPVLGQQGLFLRGDATWAAVPQGTVTSIAMTVPAEFAIAGTPVTSTGTLAITKVTQSANTFWAGPGTGAAAQPAFRSITPVDMPVMVGATGIASGVAGSVPAAAAGQQAFFLRGDGSWSTVGAGTGTVTSVGLSLPADFTVSGSPVTGIGTLTAVYANQNANLVHAGPTTGVPAAPTWRSLVVADIPAGIVATTLSSGAASNGNVLTANGIGGATWAAPAPGGVTSVAMTVPGTLLSVSGSPITTSGTLAVSLATQTANTIFAGPTTGGAVAPTFRALVAADIPSFALTNLSSGVAANGTVATANGVGGITWVSPPATGVTSVGLSLPADFTISGSPVTTTGTLTAVWAAKAKNLVLSGPASGANAVPTFRQLVIADLGSGAAANGTLATADGAGGVAWVAPAAGGAMSVAGSRASPTLITAAGGVTAAVAQRQLQFIAGNAAPITVTANPQISAGTIVGQEMDLVGRDSTNTVTFADGTGLSLNGPIVMGADSVLNLFWDGSNWVETARR